MTEPPQHKVYITSHTRPDADSIGSMCALYAHCKIVELDPSIETHFDIIMVLDDEVPKNLKHIPFADRIQPMSVLKNAQIGERDFLYVLDCATMKRCGLTQKIISQFDEHSVTIDHHETNERFCCVNVVEPKAPSCSYLLWDVFRGHVDSQDMPYEEIANSPEGRPLYEGMATALIIGLMGDSCHFSVNTAVTVEAVDSINHWYSVLFGGNRDADKPLPLQEVINGVFRSRSKESVDYQAQVLSGLKFRKAGDVGVVSYVLRDRSNLPLPLTDDTVSFYNNIDGYPVAIFVETLPSGETRVSFRTRVPDMNASELMSKHFGGGGHACAAGAVVNKSVDEVIKILESPNFF